MPQWLDLSLRIAGAVLLIGGIMWLALRRPPRRDRDKSEFDYGGASDSGASDSSSHHDAGGGSGHAG